MCQNRYDIQHVTDGWSTEDAFTLFPTSHSTSQSYSPKHHDQRYVLVTNQEKESFSSLSDEDILDVEDLIANKMVIQGKSSFQFESVRFTPKMIEFNDAFDGKHFMQKIELQNVGKKLAYVKIGLPSSFAFRMNEQDQSTKLVPPGGKITRTVSYVYYNNHIVLRSQIQIQVNGYCIDYPIIVRKAQPVIEVRPTELNFNVINMGASAKTLKLTLINSGGKGTKFAIDLGRNDLDLVVTPHRGTIRAKSQLSVSVEMAGLTEGEFYRELWITTSEKPIRVPITAEVMRPRLEVYHPNATGDFTLINFPPTFRGTQRLDSIALRNFSADMTPFAIFAEVRGELKTCFEARKLEPAFQMFTLSAEEGRLEPFESRIVVISFKPFKLPIIEGWHHKRPDENKKHLSDEFLVFFRIDRVHCMERHELEKTDGETKNENVGNPKELEVTTSATMSFPSFMTLPSSTANNNFDFGIKSVDGAKAPFFNLALPSPLEDKEVLRLCLHGSVWEPDLLVEPNCLSFENCRIKMTTAKVLKLMNQSPIKMKFKFLKAVNMHINPACQWLEPKQSIEVEVLFKPTYEGNLKNSIQIELLGQSSVLYDDDKDLVHLKTVKVGYTVLMSNAFAPPKPRISSEISCKIMNETGVKSELIRHGRKQQKRKCPSFWKLKKRNLKIPAGYDDRSDENAVVPLPTIKPNYTVEHDRSVWANYYRSCEVAEDDPFMLEIIRMELLEKRKLMKLDKIKQDKFNHQMKSILGPKNILPKLVLIPLSPIFLSNVKVEPKLIDFAMVAPNTSITETLKLHNMNSFPVSVRFIPGKSGVTLPDGDVRLILPMERKLLRISFKTKNFGRYNGFLDYVINGSHMFKITISANIVPKTLTIPESELSLVLGNYPATAAFQPNSTCITLVNSLRAPVKFHWEMQSDSAFYVEPTNGQVPPMTSMLNHVYYVVNPEKPNFSEANLVSESGAIQTVKLYYMKFKSNVYFSVNKIDLHEIPLNLLEIVNARLINDSYFDVAFVVMDCSPLPGIKISPRQGIIKARSYYDLQIDIQIPVIIVFQFDLKVYIQNDHTISAKVYGTVVFPMVKITPSEVTMRKICVQSFDMASICIENVGKTRCRININLKDYPEYKIARIKNNITNKTDEEIIYLAPNKSFKFFIIFEPKDIARYQFYLPIVINGILGPAMLQDSLTENPNYYLEKIEESYLGLGRLTRSRDLKLKIPCACINCTVAGHLLKFSSIHTVFRKPVNKGEKTEEIEIKNMHGVPVSICIRTDEVNNPSSPFKLEVMKNQVERYEKSLKIDLRVGESVTLIATFAPFSSGRFTVQIPVFLKDYNDGYAYNILTLTGESKKAIIQAETREIHFPPVPTRVGTEAIIQVYAKRYTRPETITSTIIDTENNGKITEETLKISWLDEPKITGTMDYQAFSVQISFHSSTPVSLRTFLILTDGKEEYFPILITAVADNCSITSHLFLSTRSTKYKLVYDEPPAKPKVENSFYSRKDRHKSTLSYSPSNKKDVKKHKNKISNKNSDTDELSDRGKINPGPKLVIQATKSMQRLTQLNFVWISKDHHRFGHVGINKSISDVLSDSTKSSMKIGKDIFGTSTDVGFPNFPNREENSYYEKYLKETLNYVELWIYEVVFHCEEYMVIPNSFQVIGSESYWTQNKDLKVEIPKKTIIDLVTILAGPKVLQYFPPKPIPSKDPVAKAEYLYSVFDCLLNFLAVQGSFLPHVKPEILLCYQDYLRIFSKRPVQEILKNNTKYSNKNPLQGLSQHHGTSSRPVSVDYLDHWDNMTSYIIFNEASSKTTHEENFYGPVSDSREKKYEDQDESDEMDGILFGWKGSKLSDNDPLKDLRYIHDELDAKTFNSRSTQAWLDVILQIYRTLVLPKIIFKKTSFLIPELERIYSTEVNCFPAFSRDKSSRHRVSSSSTYETMESNIYTYHELLLLAWLRYHYEHQRAVLWPAITSNETRKVAPLKTIDSFRTDLTDGLVLMAVTASYCPYLVPHFADVFYEPENQEQIYHNAIKLTNAWREVNIAFTVEAKDIVISNCVFMLMVVSHLYEVLPHLTPRSLIYFAAPLTKGITKSIEVYSRMEDRVIYGAKFIGSQEGSFELINSSTICLQVRKKYELKIAYRAKRVHKVSVTLLLDGACVSPYFAKTVVFQLEGEPSELTEYSRIQLHGFLYQVTCMDIPITSPYPEKTTYEISYSTVSPKSSDPKLYEMKPWREIWNRKTSRRLFINQSYLDYPDDSKALLSVTIACLTVASRKFWLLFHSEVGDFIVMIEISTKFREDACAPIPVILPHFDNSDVVCTCVDVKKNLSQKVVQACPFLQHLKVPARNYYLWDTMLTMFQKTLDPKEKMFWKQHFETNIGIRLIKWLLSQDESPEVTDEFLLSLRTNVTYTVNLDSEAGNYITVPCTIEIRDVRSREPVYLPIHISNKIPNELKVTLTMTSDSKKEIRTINYEFKKNSQKNVESEVTINQ